MTAAKAMFIPLTLVGNRALALSVLRGSIRTVSTCTRYQLSTGIGRPLFNGRMKTILPVAATSALPATVRSRRTFCVRATTESEDSATSIESSLMQSMQQKIKEQLNAESVVVKDAYGDGRHVSIDVISSAFEGQSAVNRQRMVYKAVWEELQDTVHAVDQMTTKTPSEAGK